MVNARADGALLGLALGDAMGAPLEGMPPPPRRVTDMRGGGRHGVLPGQYTDDTLQTCAVAESLTICRGFSSQDLAQRLISGYRSHPEFYGPTSGAVLDLIELGWPPEEAARIIHISKGGSRTNGSVMRGVPIGIFYRSEAVKRVSMACSRVTHFDPAAGECSAFVNRMVSELCRGHSRETAYRIALRDCKNRELLELLTDYRGYPPVPSLDAVLCTHCAVSVFMESQSFEEALTGAINLGGDADTAGAICGALAGAAWGINAPPLRWLTVLQDWQKILLLSRRLWWAGQR
jgi:ADP-ribosyl-[dinitrogen reductase] hydrolase